MSTLFLKSTLLQVTGQVQSPQFTFTPPPTTRTRLILPSPCPQPGQGEAKIQGRKPPLDAHVCAKSSRCSRQNPTSHNLTSRACPTSYASCTGANRPPPTITSLTAPAQKQLPMPQIFCASLSCQSDRGRGCGTTARVTSTSLDMGTPLARGGHAESGGRLVWPIPAHVGCSAHDILEMADIRQPSTLATSLRTANTTANGV